MNTEANKQLVTRYNQEVIAGCNMALLQEMASPGFINHSALPGMPGGLDGMIYFFTGILHAAFSDVKVAVNEMLAEGDKVATRKEISGTHTAELMGIPATGRQVTIQVIDILRIQDGKITDHWGENNFPGVVQSLQQ